MGRKAVQKVVKEVQIIARYTHKCNGVETGLVSYKVRSSNSVDTYCTTLLNGIAVGCNCKAYKPCYHMTQLQVIEQARREKAAYEAFITASNIVATPVTSVEPTPCKGDATPEQIWALTQDNELGLLAFMSTKLPTATETVQNNLTSGRPIDIGTAGSLSSNARVVLRHPIEQIRRQSSIERSLPPIFMK